MAERSLIGSPLNHEGRFCLPVKTPAPTVSVLMTTFNHGRFIRQAVESVLNQQTDFSIEIVIGEDCSTDDTRKILEEIVRFHGENIRLLLRDRNMGANLNFADALTRCRGEFIAYLDGDDYWLGTEKLQRQVNFLRTHSDCSLCFHDAFVLDPVSPDQLHRRYCVPKPAAFITLDDVLAGSTLPTCSAVYRRALLPALPSSIQPLPMQDWPMWTLLALSGRVAYLDETWGCYRLHSGGTWSPRKNEYKLRNALCYYAVMYTTLDRAHHLAISRAEKIILSKLVALLIDEGRWRDARTPAKRYLFLAPKRFRAPPGRAGLYIRLVFGWPSATMKALSQRSL